MENKQFKCKNCEGKNYKVKYDFLVRKILQCQSCHLMIIDPVPCEKELRQVYNENYFSNLALTTADVNNVFGYVDYISERINKQSGYEKICKTLRKYSIPPSIQRPKLLDFGCGLGFFLETANQYGFDVSGLEFNNFAIDYIKKIYPFKVELFDNDKFGQIKYQIITFFDVIEHLRDPFKILKKT